MQGSIFIITSWLLVFTFLFYTDRTNIILLNLSGILLLISFSAYTIDVFSIDMNISYIIMIFLISYQISLVRFLEQIVYFFKGLIIGMVYCVITLLSIYDPASFYFHEMIISSLIVILLALFLSNNYDEKVRFVIIGLIQGEIFNYITFKSINYKYVIGDLGWFDHLFFTILLLSAVHYITIYLSKLSLKNRKLLKS